MRTEPTDTTRIPYQRWHIRLHPYQPLYTEEDMYGQTKPLTPQNIQGTLHAIRIRSLSERIEDRRKDQLG